jgi:hypothetical protein
VGKSKFVVTKEDIVKEFEVYRKSQLAGHNRSTSGLKGKNTPIKLLSSTKTNNTSSSKRNTKNNIYFKDIFKSLYNSKSEPFGLQKRNSAGNVDPSHLFKIYKPSLNNTASKENLTTDYPSHKKVTNSSTDESRPSNAERCKGYVNR